MIKQLVPCLALAAFAAAANCSAAATVTIEDVISPTSVVLAGSGYGAAVQYAEQNNVTLGTQLSAAQLALVNAPMLWYVEQTVPEPGCTVTGNGACPTVQALMPEVLLPQNYAQVNADGEINGTNVTLDYTNSVLNTGSVSAGNLTVNTGTLTNEERSVNVGTVYQYQALDGSVTQTTGTVVQQGGFMSAANYDLNAQAINQIGGALQQVNADSSVNVAGTQALLANLQSQLGSNFTQSTVSDQLTMTVVGAPSVFDDAFMMVIIATISIATSVFASPVAGAMLSSAMSQLNSDQAFSLGNVAEAGAVAYLTVGVNQYLGLTDLSTVGTNVMSSNAPVTFENLGKLAVEIGEQSVVDAAISTAIEGGSFLTALENNAVASLAAVGAGAIGGDAGITPGSFESIALHSVLGCASSAALGTGCAGGAIGGATSALVSPYLVEQAGGIANLTPDQRAAIVTAATFLGGTAGAALGQNVTGATTAATNEALNNSTNKQDTTAHKTGQQNEGEKDTLSIVPPAGGAIDEENAGDAPVAGKGTAAAAAAGATNNSEQGLDWSIVSKSGETRADHVIDQHGDLNLNKPNQGVFYGDPVSTVNNAWNTVQQADIQPVTNGGTDIYVVPRPNSGYAGGYTGQRQNLNSVTIITVHGTNQVITAFPGNGLPLPKAP